MHERVVYTTSVGDMLHYAAVIWPCSKLGQDLNPLYGPDARPSPLFPESLLDYLECRLDVVSAVDLLHTQYVPLDVKNK